MAALTEAPEVGLAFDALIHEHAWLFDHGQADRIVELYTDDASVLGIGPDKIGREAIAAWASERAAMTGRCSRHAQSNIRLVPAAAGQVGGTVLLTLYRFDGAGPGPATPLLVAEYDDLYQQGPDGRWRFKQRRLTTVFSS